MGLSMQFRGILTIWRVEMRTPATLCSCAWDVLILLMPRMWDGGLLSVLTFTLLGLPCSKCNVSYVAYI